MSLSKCPSCNEFQLRLKVHMLRQTYRESLIVKGLELMVSEWVFLSLSLCLCLYLCLSISPPPSLSLSLSLSLSDLHLSQISLCFSCIHRRSSCGDALDRLWLQATTTFHVHFDPSATSRRSLLTMSPPSLLVVSCCVPSSRAKKCSLLFVVVVTPLQCIRHSLPTLSPLLVVFIPSLLEVLAVSLLQLTCNNLFKQQKI